MLNAPHNIANEVHAMPVMSLWHQVLSLGHVLDSQVHGLGLGLETYR